MNTRYNINNTIIITKNIVKFSTQITPGGHFFILYKYKYNIKYCKFIFWNLL